MAINNQGKVKTKKKKLVTDKKAKSTYRNTKNNAVKTKKRIAKKGLATKNVNKKNSSTKISNSKKIRIPLLRHKKRSFLIFAIIFSIVVFNVWLFWGVPSPTRIAENPFPISTILYDRNGEVIYEIFTDRKSTPVPLDEIPDYVKQATIAIEDKDFYSHFGISFTGILRAAYKTASGQRLEGGSTLTQQLVKNSLLTPERTVKRKVREIALTIIVEAIYTKDQILEIYLNQIPYGSTAYGIEAAADLYFDKAAKDLTLGEAALLAGMPAAPTKFSPFGANPDLAEGRQNAVLRRMVEDGYIDQEKMDEALNEELVFAKTNAPKAPHFALWVKEVLAEKYGDALVEQGGLRVTTTLDLELQEIAQESVKDEVDELKKLNVGNGAAVVTKPKTGEILAMVGSKDYFSEDEDGKVNIIFRERQPGSSIKPLNYGLGIEDRKITASTPLADVPTCFGVLGQQNYCPKNYDNSFHGIPQVRYSLANSYNIPAVRVMALNGIENFVEFATNLGITTWNNPDNYGLSLTLGGGEVKPYDMATAFGVLANQGVRQELFAITKVEDHKGNVLFEVNEDELDKGRVMEAGAAFIISDILKDNGARSAAFGSSSFLNVKDYPEVSVKTGTTNNLRDNWTIGYTSDAVVVVWVGNNDNTPMSGAVSGVSGASPIWNRIMKVTLDKTKEGKYGDPTGNTHLIKPDNVIGVNVCSDSGNRPEEGNGCPTRFEYFLNDAIGARLQIGTQDMQIQKDTGQQANPDLPPELVETQNHPFILDPLGTLYCLNCPIASHSATISYPLPSRN